MAVIDLDGSYLKVLYDECMVKGDNIYVTFITYPTEADRLREKNTDAAYNAFVGKIWDKIRSYQTEINSMIKEYEETQSEELGHQINDKIKERDKYINQWNNINNNRILPIDKEPEFINYISDDELAEFGFDKSWIENPIRTNGVVQTLAGNYQTMTRAAINTSFYYDRLKSIMNEGVKDV